MILKQFQAVPGLWGKDRHGRGESESSDTRTLHRGQVLVKAGFGNDFQTANRFARTRRPKIPFQMRFSQGKTAITAATFDAAALDAAIAEIQRLVGMTFARATIKCAGKSDIILTRE